MMHVFFFNANISCFFLLRSELTIFFKFSLPFVPNQDEISEVQQRGRLSSGGLVLM